MKSLLLISLSGFPKKDTGGPNKIIYLLMKYLDEKLYDVYFYSKNGALNKKELNNSESSLRFNFQLYKEKLFSESYFYKLFFMSRFYATKFLEKSINSISEFLDQNDFDIIHAHDVRCLFKLYNERLMKTVLTIHSIGSIEQDMRSFYGQKKWLIPILDEFKQMEKEIVSKIRKVIFPSYSSRELFLNDNGLYLNEMNSEIIYNGIDIKRINSIFHTSEFLNEFNWLNNYSLRILNVANHVKTKNIDKILLSLSILKKISSKKFVFINIGSGILTPYLMELVKKYNLSENVHFINYLANDDVIRLMKYCDFYISLSERVVFDVVILEAIASGINVIASDDGGNREIIRHNFNGLLVQPDDYEQIARYLNDSDIDFSENMKETAKEFSVEKMVEKYTKIYDSIS